MKHRVLYRALVEQGASFRPEQPFSVEGVSRALLPAVIPNSLERCAIYYDCSASELHDSLHLFIKESSVIFDKDFLSKTSYIEGFQSSALDEKNLFYSSLSSDFKNHRFVFFPTKLSEDLIFNVSSSHDGFVVDFKTSYSSLVGRLEELGYSSVDFIESRGDFALRGLVVDFFPFGFRYGVRVLFDGDSVSGIYRLNIKTQLSEQSLSCFHLIRPVVSNKLTSFDRIVSSIGLNRIFLEKNAISFFKQSAARSYRLNVSLVSSVC